MDLIYHDYSSDSYNPSENQPIVAGVKDEDIGIDFSKIGQDDSLVISSPVGISEEKPKRKRRTGDPNKVVKVSENKSSSNNNGLEPFEKKYEETNNMLKEVIAQTNMSMADINEDIRLLRNSKTVRNKYTYLSNLTDASASMLSNKLNAIKEMNNSITKAQDFEMKRAKELHLNDNVDDDKAIQDMYKAFVTASVPNPYAALGPTSRDMTIRNDAIIAGTIPNNTIDDVAAYNNYVQNMTPQQHMIALENDPNVQQVVVWNKSTGAKSFEIMNMATGEILQNVDKHDIMFMEDTTIDERNHTARNIKLNESYPLVVIGESAIDEY